MDDFLQKSLDIELLSKSVVEHKEEIIMSKLKNDEIDAKKYFQKKISA